jgi:diguanylate cyclase (GGDEF)-like protein
MPEKYRDSYILTLRRENAGRLFIFALLNTVLQIISIISEISGSNFSEFISSWLGRVWLVKLAFLIIFTVIFFNYLIKKKAPSTMMGLCNYYFVVIYIFFQLLLVRYELAEQSAVYAFAYGALLIGVIPVFDMLESLTVSSAYMVIMLLQLFLVSIDQGYFIHSMLFILFFSIIAFMSSRIVYVTFARNFVSERVANEKKDMIEQRADNLELLSNTDQLTAILNRRGFEQSFGALWKECVQSQKFISVMMIDIDKFKQYNDNYGHPEGDKCLMAVASTLKAAFMRKSDIICRYGGEEFIATMAFTDIARAYKQAERFRNMIADLRLPHAYSGIEPYITVSVGVAGFIPTEEDSPKLLIEMADKALYAAKEGGRNKVEVI